jgi:peroxiredoxin
LVTDFASAFEQLKKHNVELYPITTSDTLEQARELETKYARGKYPIYCDQEKQIFKVLPQDWTRYMADKIPAIFIIDKKGIVRQSFYKDHTKELPKIEEVLELIDKFAK